MKSIFVLSTTLACASAFAIAPAHTRTATSLSALIDKADMTPDQLEIENIREKWNEVRLMSREEADSLDDEWKAAHTKFYDKYDSDMELFQQIVERLQKSIDPPKVAKKTKGQRKRDAFAKKQAREEARAAQK